MSQILTDQDFANAKRDISDIDKAVNTESIVDPRWGGDFKSLPMVSKEWDAKSQDAQNSINLWKDAINTITIDDGIPALAVSTANGNNQQAVNDLGGVDYWAARAYQTNNEVRLTDGTIVISTIDNNSNNPNSDMTGWKKKNSADQIFDESGLSQQVVNRGLNSISELLSINNPPNGSSFRVKGLAGGLFVYDSAKSALYDGVVNYYGWVRQVDCFVTPFMAGALLDGSDSTEALQKTFDYARANNLIVFGAYKTLKASNVIVRSNLKVEALNLEQNVFDQQQSVLTTDYGMLSEITNIEFSEVNIDGKRDLHTNVGISMDGGRCCFLVRRPINGLTIRKSKFVNAVTDGLMLFPVDWITPTWTHRVKNVILEDFTSTGHGRWGVSSDSSDGITMIRCILKYNGLNTEDGADYTTGKAGRLHNGNLYGGGFDLEEYEGRAYSKNITLIDCDMRDNAGASLEFTRTGGLVATSTNINIIRGQYNKGTVVDSTNTLGKAINISTYSATGILSAYNINIDGSDLGGDKLYLKQSQITTISNLKRVSNIVLDQSVVDADVPYNYTINNPSNSSFRQGIKIDGSDFLGKNNSESTVWIHNANNLGAVSKLNIRSNGVNIGGIDFEKAQGSGSNGVNYHFKNGSETRLTINQYGHIFPQNGNPDIGTTALKFKQIFLTQGVGMWGTNPPSIKPSVIGKNSPTTISEQNEVINSLIAALVAYGVIGDNRT